MTALRGPAGTLLASVVFAGLFGGAALAVTGSSLAVRDRHPVESMGQAPTHGTDTLPVSGTSSGSGYADGGGRAPQAPGAQGHQHADQHGQASQGHGHAAQHGGAPQDRATHGQGHAAQTHGSTPHSQGDGSGRSSGTPGQPAPASNGSGQGGSPHA